MILKILFNIGETVVHKTDKERRKMVITGIMIRENGNIIYYCSSYENEVTFYGYELERIIDNEKPSVGQIVSIDYIKALEYDQYIDFLGRRDEEEIKEIIEYLVGEEEYEMAEVTKRYLNRLHLKE